MNIGELKRMIATLPDWLPVVVPAADHSYTLANVETMLATRTGPRTFTEDDSDAEGPAEANTAVLVVG